MVSLYDGFIDKYETLKKASEIIPDGKTKIGSIGDVMKSADALQAVGSLVSAAEHMLEIARDIKDSEVEITPEQARDIWQGLDAMAQIPRMAVYVDQKLMDFYSEKAMPSQVSGLDFKLF